MPESHAAAPAAAPDLAQRRDRAPAARAGRRTFTLRFTLLTLILGLLAVSGLAANAVWFVATRETTEELNQRFFTLSARSAARRTSELLRPAEHLLREYGIKAQRGLIRIDDSSALGETLAERLRASRFTQLHYAEGATGRFVGAWQPVEGTVVLTYSTPSVEGGAFSEWTLNSNGTRTPYRRDLPASYDARRRPWYERAVAQGEDGLVWTDPYTFFDGAPGITAAQAWRNTGDAEPRGVFAVDFTLADMRSFLTDSARLRDARVFLVTRHGELVVSSAPSQGDPGDEIWMVVRGALPQPLESLQLDDPVQVEVSFAGQSYLAVVQLFQVASGLEWAVATVVPEARFLAAAIANMKLAVTLSLAVLLTAIGLGWLVSVRVARPLRRITEDLEQIGRLNLTREPSPKTFIREIAVVSDGVDRMKTSLRSFGRYVPVDLVRQVIASGKEARLSGETRELTLLFSDIAGFTTISERLASDALVAQLAEYLEAMTAAIRADGGTIDKFIGDGIVAFFNAPQLLSAHATAACRAALRAQASLQALNERWTAAGLPAFPTRIGLNTGEVVVGNIGTAERFAYTAIGDAMNLASRIEGLNKAYGTAILASEAVRAAAGAGFAWRRLDRVAVVGRRGGTLVFELLGETDRASQDLLVARDRYEAALDAYFAARFDEAAAGFAVAARMRPGDQAAALMAQRAHDLARNPPGAGWDGVVVSLRK